MNDMLHNVSKHVEIHTNFAFFEGFLFPNRQDSKINQLNPKMRLATHGNAFH